MTDVVTLIRVAACWAILIVGRPKPTMLCKKTRIHSCRAVLIYLSCVERGCEMAASCQQVQVNPNCKTFVAWNDLFTILKSFRIRQRKKWNNWIIAQVCNSCTRSKRYPQWYPKCLMTFDCEDQELEKGEMKDGRHWRRKRTTDTSPEGFDFPLWHPHFLLINLSLDFVENLESFLLQKISRKQLKWIA